MPDFEEWFVCVGFAFKEHADELAENLRSKGYIVGVKSSKEVGEGNNDEM